MVLRIGDMLLPPALLSLIMSGGWLPPEVGEILIRVFRDEPDNPRFYGLEDLIRQNEMWQSLSHVEVFREVSLACMLGILPQMSIVIGNLGIDMPIVLDYRESASNPRVLCLLFDESPRWIEIASGVDELFGLLYGENYVLTSTSERAL